MTLALKNEPIKKLNTTFKEEPKIYTPINLQQETKIIISDLGAANGYLDCEKVIIRNIRKHLGNGFSFSVIEGFLKKIWQYFTDLAGIKKDSADCINFNYVTAFVYSLITTPYWHSWISCNRI